jgi:membrane-associated phospholipid phosphatase
MKKLAGPAVVATLLMLAGAARPSGAQALDALEGPVPAKAIEGRPLAWDGPRDDGQRTLGGFPRNLGRNFVGVVSGQNLVPFAVGVAATATASAFDSRTQDLLQGACSSCGRTGATVGGSAMVPIVGALFVAGRFSPQGRFRAATYDFAQALIVNGAYSGLLKYSVRRERPDGADKLSFPSGHSSTAFSLAAVASHHYGWKVGVPAYALASGIGLSRIESSRHHLSDVLAGATLGLVVGRTVARLDGERPAKERVVSVGPATDAYGQGVGLSLSASW